MNKMKGTKRRSKLRGGLVFEGSEGCVFSPELTSTGSLLSTAKYPKRSGRFITKVYRRPEDLKTELQGIAIMKQIDPTQQYTKTFIDTSVTPDIKSIDLQTERCTKPITATSPALYMYYNGLSIKTLRQRGIINEVLKPLLLGLSRLSELFVKMAKLNVVHGDVQPGNILYNREDGRVYLIDFTSMQVLPGLTDKTVDIKSLGIIVRDLIFLYKKAQSVESTCETVVSQILDDITPKINQSKDVEAIQTMLVNSIDIVLKKCFAGRGRRKTLRRSRHKVNGNMH